MHVHVDEIFNKPTSTGFLLSTWSLMGYLLNVLKIVEVSCIMVKCLRDQ